MQKIVIFMLALMLALMLTFPVAAKQDKGKGAGGVRDDHASEIGLEKGKAWAWAGTKEKKGKKKLKPQGY